MFRFATPATPRQALRRLCRVALACSAAVLLSSCGGGDRAAPYKPNGVVAFGDENGAFGSFTSDGSVAVGQALLSSDGSTHATLKGLTYSVNPVTAFGPYFNAVTTPDCAYNDAIVLPLTGPSDTALTTTSSSCPRLYLMDASTGFPTTVVRVEDGMGNVSAANARKTSGVFYKCSTASNWVQAVAHSFGKGFNNDCPLDGSGAITYAAANSKVADVAAQVDAALAAGKVGSGTLAIFMTGQNDVIEIYNNSSLVGIDAKKAEAVRRAMLLSESLIRALRAGAKVVYANVPALGFSPRFASLTYTSDCGKVYGTVQRTDKSVVTHNCDMDAIVQAFNDALFEDGMIDYAQTKGDQFAYVETDSLLIAYVKNTSYVNAAVCNTGSTGTMTYPDGTTDTTAQSSLLYCTSNTLVTNGSLSTYLWADDAHLAPLMQLAVGSLAATRAANQF